MCIRDSSSALWPFSTLGWPNEDSADLKYFYPTNTLVTGYDIIGFWVSRMIFSGLAYTGKAPFDTDVYKRQAGWTFISVRMVRTALM